MNIIEAMQVWRYDLPYGTGGQQEYIDAAIKIDHILAEYLGLKPDWTQAQEWAQWYAIDADGLSYWYEYEPTLHDSGDWMQLDHEEARALIHCFIRIPLGIDWRLCKWQRP